MKYRWLLATRLAAFGLVGAVAAVSLLSSGQIASAYPTGGASAPTEAAVRCAKLAGTTIAGARVDKAEFLAEGGKAPAMPGAPGAGACRIDFLLSPVTGSEIKMVVWLPETWNGKLIGVGGSSFNGGLKEAARLRSPWAQKGYATVVTNAGHDPQPEATWAYGNFEKIVDFGHRANHLAAVVAKATIVAHYGKPPSRSLFRGCSNGGRDALMLAQRYPEDYDAIVAGAPANNWTALLSGFVRRREIARISPGADPLGPKLKLIHAAAMRKCDALDGAKDGLIEHPPACKFDPSVLQCKSGNGADCLSKAELKAVKGLYSDVRTRDGKLVLSGMPVGSENRWDWLTAPRGASGQFARQFFRYMVYDNPQWEVTQFDLDRDYPVALQKMGPILDAENPDLRPFLNRGGRLLMYHGWDDNRTPAMNTINYFTAMRKATGKLGAERTRLFMLPGVGHCGGGITTEGYVDALERWVDTGIAPERLIAKKVESATEATKGAPGKVVATRPVCAWPKLVRYKGAGPLNAAGSYVCR